MFYSPSRKRKFAVGMSVVAVLLLSGCRSNSATSTPSSMPSQPATIEPTSVVAKNGTLAVDLTASESLVPYDTGTRWAMTYNGTVQGPTIVVHPGDELTINLINTLSVPTSLHTHGLHVAPSQDDPFVMVDPGKSHSYVYDIPLNQRAGTFWYHPHVHGSTAEQVASGLSGAILVEDMDDDQLSSISSNHVLVINDPLLSRSNPWGDSSNSGMGNMPGMDHGSSGIDMMSSMMGRTGPHLLTNGFRGIKLSATQGKLERLHIVNATASSRLKFSFTGKQMLELSNDGGRLTKPVDISSLTLASGERAEIILVPDLRGGVLSAQRLSNELGGKFLGKPEKIATIPSGAGVDTSVIPSTFMMASTQDLFAPSVTPDKRRVVTLSEHMNPRIDGHLFDPNVVNFVARKGTVEEWVIENTSPMYHPIHLHTWGFQIKGELGWHDTVVVPPHSKKVVRVAFDDFTGTTVVHCHILDHEDTGMMAIIKVE